MSTMGGDLAAVMVRELDRLARELEAYEDEADIWRLEGTARNSAGTLALHLVGNLNHYVGGALGDTGYVRDRDAEFGERDVPRAELLRRIADCKETVTDTLAPLDAPELAGPYPREHMPAVMDGASVHRFLVHLTWHLGWHVGQVDYHRRILTGGEPV